MDHPADADADPAETDAPKRWGLPHALVGWVVAFLAASVASTAYAVATGLEADELTLGRLVASFAGLWLGLGATVLYAKSLTPGGTLRSEFGLAFKAVDAGIGLLTGLGTQIILLRIVYLPWILLDDDFGKRLDEPAERLTGTAEGAGYLVLSLFIALGAPLVEELFFRGLLQRSLLRRFSPAVAIGLGGLLFGLAHLDPITIPGLTAFGIVAGWLAYRYQRLGPAIWAHVFFNLVTVIALA